MSLVQTFSVVLNTNFGDKTRHFSAKHFIKIFSYVCFFFFQHDIFGMSSVYSLKKNNHSIKGLE